MNDINRNRANSDKKNKKDKADKADKKDKKDKSDKKEKRDKKNKKNGAKPDANPPEIMPNIPENEYKIGDIVFAAAGRDEGRIFAVVGIIDADYVQIADGRSRRADSPKRKKIKHIKLIKKAAENFVETLKSGRFTNAGLRKMLSEKYDAEFTEN